MSNVLMPRERRWLNSAQVRKRYGDVSLVTLWARVKAGQFPKPTKFGNRNYWDEVEDLEAFEAAQRALRDQPRAA